MGALRSSMRLKAYILPEIQTTNPRMACVLVKPFSKELSAADIERLLIRENRTDRWLYFTAHQTPL